MRSVPRRSQRGSVIVTVALLLLMLLGFIGFALDFGRLFIVKSELQTALDACALAAAQELDLQPDALDRARSAGLTAGNLNRVNLQSANWAGQGQLVSADITFKDTSYRDTTDPAQAQYAQCQHTQPAVRMWLLQAMGVFSGDTTNFPSTRDVSTVAVATRAHGQTTCPIPVALKPKECPPNSGIACPKPDYGFKPGEWVTVLTSQGATPSGYIGWANLNGSKDAAETRAEMDGSRCITRVNDILGTPGTQTTIAEDWNYRFGIYKKTPNFSTDPDYMRPDFSGYAYTDHNWPPNPASPNPNVRNAWNGTPYADPTGTAKNFSTKRANFAACGTSVSNCENVLSISLNSFKAVAASGSGAGSHGQWGTNRRIVTVPVTDSSNKVIDFACMLMLQPLSIPMTDVQMEYIGNAGNPDSPCSFSGMPGGTAGPLVPALVR